MSQKIDNFKSTLITPLPDAEATFVIENLYCYELNVTPEQIWPYLTDTSRMNKELNFSPRFETEINGENHVKTKTLGKDEEWIEKPWIWIHEKELQFCRTFKKGWMTELRGVFTLSPTENGCVISIYFRWSFSNLFNRILFSPIGYALNKKFREFFKNKEQLILNPVKEEVAESIIPLEPLPPYEVLLNYFKTADELELDRIHIKKVAKIVDLPVDLLLDVAHQMIKDGLLTLSWEIICPHCRGARSKLEKLSLINEMNTCEVCKVEFDLSPEESVEVVFHLTEKVRKLSNAVYCAAEPAKRKHIKLTQQIPAGEIRTYPVDLKPGNYRLRSKGVTSSVVFKVEEGSMVTNVAWRPEILPDFIANTSFDLVVTNPTESEITINLEDTWWYDDRLTPKEVLTNPGLRTLFSEDHLKVGVKLNLGNQTILFTDIVGSTAFYLESGDAIALKAVKAHYDEVAEVITANKGVVIKYIGDAVMAAFLSLEDGLRAAIDIHKKFPPGRTDNPIKLRASLRHGPVICANVNVGLDYFGSTVNQSAKIQKWAEASEIALTESDWKSVLKMFSKLKTRQVVKDEKLDLEVRVLLIK